MLILVPYKKTLYVFLWRVARLELHETRRVAARRTGAVFQINGFNLELVLNIFLRTELPIYYAEQSWLCQVFNLRFYKI